MVGNWFEVKLMVVQTLKMVCPLSDSTTIV